MSAKDVAEAFVNHYYSTFDSNRAQLATLYQPTSILSWEGTDITGSEAIMAKLNSLPGVQHQKATMDVQPTQSQNAIIIFVTGKIAIDNGNPLQYSQVFQLVAQQPGAYYLQNDIFRLVYA